MKGVMRFGKKGKLIPRVPSFHDKEVYWDPVSIIPIEGIGMDENLSHEEVLVEILDRQVRNKEVTSLKVLWKNHLVQGATKESKADMKSHYPHIIANLG
ncbi:hypothetical protein EJD97_001135 [Solanum chilense]|uniref:Chromo domain-containing protein n=1 Tax=Solanum chilense TaxID=4083 RepID=A0A6N2CF33_SOLCI|nr:hypothetical protein EJD97_001135 [Solanum chilense]